MNRKRLIILAVSIFLCFVAACSRAKKEETPKEDSVVSEDTRMSDNSVENTPEEDLLLIVDFQNVYLPGYAWGCPSIEQSMANTLDIVRSINAPDYVLTKFIAPKNPKGCWVRYNEEYADINADPYLSELADSIKEIATDDNVIEKSTYSSLDSAEVCAYLTGKKRVVLAGVAADCCVLATMMDAIDMGYEVIYLDDCISGYSEENERMVRDLVAIFTPVHTRIMSSREYLRSIGAE